MFIITTTFILLTLIIIWVNALHYLVRVSFPFCFDFLCLPTHVTLRFYDDFILRCWSAGKRRRNELKWTEFQEEEEEEEGEDEEEEEEEQQQQQ